MLKITKEKLIANFIYFLVPAIVSFCIIFTFDIHHSLYSRLIFPLEFIFQTPAAYMFGIPAGMVVGFIVIKLLIFAVRKDLEISRAL